MKTSHNRMSIVQSVICASILLSIMLLAANGTEQKVPKSVFIGDKEYRIVVEQPTQWGISTLNAETRYQEKKIQLSPKLSRSDLPMYLLHEIDHAAIRELSVGSPAGCMSEEDWISVLSSFEVKVLSDPRNESVREFLFSNRSEK